MGTRGGYNRDGYREEYGEATQMHIDEVYDMGNIGDVNSKK